MVTVERVQLAYNNVYIVEHGSDVVVIDTGPDYRGAREILSVALRGRTPRLVIATHGHLDHASLGAWWQSLGVPVMAGRHDLHMTTGEDRTNFEQMERYIRTIGAPAEVVDEVEEGLKRRRDASRVMRTMNTWAEGGDGRWPTALRYEPFTPQELIDSPENVACGLTVLPSPGHTPGNLVVVQPEEGWLFSGDQLLPEITPTPAIQFEGSKRFQSLPRFLESLRTLSERWPHLKECFPGHGEPFADPEEEIRANLGLAEQRSSRVMESLRVLGPGTTYEVALREYPRALRRRFWPIIATIQGQLDVLHEAGEVRCETGRWSVSV
ncbi:MAG: MBL fold metallo-hydrolase [Dehalococcoidia bacterium]